MDYPNNINNWLSDIKGQNIYFKIISQIVKDFELTGLSISLNSNTSPSELINVLYENIFYLVNHDFNIFTQLLYRIDIPEKVISSKQYINTAENMSQKATVKIIKREYQKVKFREQFS